MNRRQFLVSIGGLTASIAFPLGAAPPEVGDVPTLINWFENQFAFQMGAPWGFVEERPAQFMDHPEDPAWWTKHENRDYSSLTPYATYSIDAPSETEAVAALHKGFSAAVSRFPNLRHAPAWWRLKEKIQIKESVRRDPGEIVFTEEQVMDSDGDLDLSGLENDFSGCWRRKTEPYRVVTLRTRIAMPALDSMDLNGLPVHLSAAGFMVQAMDCGHYIPLEAPEGVMFVRGQA